MTKDVLDSRETEDDGRFKFFGFARFLVLLLAVVCVSCMQSNTLALNFTIICMGEPFNEYECQLYEKMWCNHDYHLTRSSCHFSLLTHIIIILDRR